MRTKLLLLCLAGCNPSDDGRTRLEGRYSVQTMTCEGEQFGCDNHQLLGAVEFEIAFDGRAFAILSFDGMDGSPLASQFEATPGGCSSDVPEPSSLALADYMAAPDPDGIYSDGCVRECTSGCDVSVYYVRLNPVGFAHYEVFVLADRI